MYRENGLNYNPTIDNPDGTNRNLDNTTAANFQTFTIVTIPNSPANDKSVLSGANNVGLNIRPSGPNTWDAPGRNGNDFGNGGQAWFNGAVANLPNHNNQPNILTVEAATARNFADGVELSANSTNFCNGDIAEIIGYGATNTSGDQQKIESYLAIKYGITLDQTTATDYLASDGSTIMWDATAAGTYNNAVSYTHL